jgi:hypothetical protein
LRNRAYRRRSKAGRMTALVEFGPEVVDFLITSRWLELREDDVYSRGKIGAAISNMLADSARR